MRNASNGVSMWNIIAPIRSVVKDKMSPIGAVFRCFIWICRDNRGNPSCHPVAKGIENVESVTRYRKNGKRNLTPSDRRNVHHSRLMNCLIFYISGNICRILYEIYDNSEKVKKRGSDIIPILNWSG